MCVCETMCVCLCLRVGRLVYLPLIDQNTQKVNKKKKINLKRKAGAGGGGGSKRGKMCQFSLLMPSSKQRTNGYATQEQ